MRNTQDLLHYWSEMFSNKERIVIEIDPDTDTYSMDVTFCNVARLQAVFTDILNKIETGELLEEPDLEVTKIDN